MSTAMTGRGPGPAGRRPWPILAWVPGYQASWLRFDVIAGLTVCAILVPEGMAYAQLAGVPPEAAFYAAPAGLLAYAVLGSSRQLVVAVSSAIAIMSAGTVSLLAPEGSADYVALTAAVIQSKYEKWEFYDIDADPQEMEDLYPSSPSLAMQMKEELLQKVSEANTPFEGNGS